MSVDIRNGDCIDIMKKMEDQSVDCCVTSPPYFGLRDYGHEEQIGLEDTPDKYVEKIVEVFGEVKRVLKDDGTVWLNLGDSYAGSWGNAGGQNRGKGTQRPIAGKSITKDADTERHGSFVPAGARGFKDNGIKPKDLIGIPWRVAFALQADGWYLRQDIIWHKPNPMPESVTDRCTKAHEYIFLLSKSAKYYCDMESVKEDSVDPESYTGRNKRNDYKGCGTKGFEVREGFKNIEQGKTYETRNKRSVWTVTTKPFKGAHFATFPPDLILPCILAGCPEGGTVLDPFGGSGTVGVVARDHSRKAILCELNPEYCNLMRESMSQGILL